MVEENVADINLAILLENELNQLATERYTIT